MKYEFYCKINTIMNECEYLVSNIQCSREESNRARDREISSVSSTLLLNDLLMDDNQCARSSSDTCWRTHGSHKSHHGIMLGKIRLVIYAWPRLSILVTAWAHM